MKKKVILIDDEPLSIKLTKSYLSEYSQFEIVAECNNGFEGLKAVNQYEPDLIFLDIQMPKINGFEMLELVEKPLSVIFTTAYDEYAIKAFEANALDYLLKPFSKDRFAKAISKYLESNTSAAALVNQQLPIHEIEYPSEEQNRIVVKSGNDIRIIPTGDILYIEAYDDYIKVNVKGDCFLKKFTMSKAESVLDSSKFIRVHRSFIVNIEHITRIEQAAKDNYVAVLRDQTKISLSKTGYPKLKAVLGI